MSAATHRAAFTRSATTADRIRQLILERELRPGDAMPTEAELCETLGVSRSSVREAIRSLATLDIVNVRHGHGTYVGEMSLDPMVQALVFRGVLSPEGSMQSLREVVEVRLALDLSMAEQIIAGVATLDTSLLRELVDAMTRKAKAGASFLEEDRAFHTVLLSATGNRLAEQLVGAFWDVHTAVLPQLGLALPDDVALTAQAHGAMLSAAIDADIDAYRRAVIDHYLPLQRALGVAS